MEDKDTPKKRRRDVNSVNASIYANASTMKDERQSKKNRCGCMRYVNASTVKDERQRRALKKKDGT